MREVNAKGSTAQPKRRRERRDIHGWLVLDKPVGTVKTWLRRARIEVLNHLRRRGMVH